MLALLLVAQSAPGAVTAEQAMARHQTEVDAKSGLKCPRGGDGEEIVVCGRRPGSAPPGSEFRVPYVPEPGRRIPGEAVVDGGGCIRLCHQPVTIEIFNSKGGGAVGSVVRGIRRALED
jgi:hypothetical protein